MSLPRGPWPKGKRISLSFKIVVYCFAVMVSLSLFQSLSTLFVVMLLFLSSRSICLITGKRTEFLCSSICVKRLLAMLTHFVCFMHQIVRCLSIFVFRGCQGGFWWCCRPRRNPLKRQRKLLLILRQSKACLTFGSTVCACKYCSTSERLHLNVPLIFTNGSSPLSRIR